MRFLQNNLNVKTLSLAFVAVLVGAGRMASERRGELLLALVQVTTTLVVVSGARLAVIALLVTASGAPMRELIARSALASATEVSSVHRSLLVIVLGGVALLMSMV